MSDPLDFIVFDNVYHSGGSNSNGGCGIIALIIVIVFIIGAIIDCCG